MIEISETKHQWAGCAHCATRMVICGHCGNNCCNGGSGQMPDGSDCPDRCASAYAMQAKGESPAMPAPEHVHELDGLFAHLSANPGD